MFERYPSVTYLLVTRLFPSLLLSPLESSIWVFFLLSSLPQRCPLGKVAGSLCDGNNGVGWSQLSSNWKWKCIFVQNFKRKNATFNYFFFFSVWCESHYNKYLYLICLSRMTGVQHVYIHEHVLHIFGTFYCICMHCLFMCFAHHVNTVLCTSIAPRDTAYVYIIYIHRFLVP